MKKKLSAIGLNSERHERGFIIKERRMIKGHNYDGTLRPIKIGWCAVFTHGGKRYKSGGYYSKDAAIRWAHNKLDELMVDKLYV